MKKYIYIPKIIISCFLLIITKSTTINAQNLAWVGNLANASYDVDIKSITQDGNSDVYVVGSFQGTVDFDMGAGVANLASPLNTSAFIAKYDLNGNFIRAFKLGDVNAGNNGTALDIAVDASNNIVVVGSFTTNGTTPINFAPLGGTSTSLNSFFPSIGTIFTVKYNALGQCIWGFRIGNGATVNTFSSVAIDASNNIYVAGKINAPTTPIDLNPLGTAQLFNSSVPTGNTGTDAIIVKYNSNGIHQWSTFMGNSVTSNMVNDLVVSGASIYAVGKFQGTTNFNPKGTAISKTTAGSNDAFIAKYNANTGVCNWAGAIGNAATQDVINTVDVDAAGNVYVGGEFRNTVDLNIGTGVSNVTAVGVIDFYVAKYSSVGTLVWGFALGKSNSNGINALSVDGTNLYITGRFKDTADFDPGVGLAELTVTTASTDATYLAKYNISDGSYINAFLIKGTSANVGRALYADAGLIYLGGSFTGTNVDFDPTGAVVQLNCSSPLPLYDGFVACYSETPVTFLEDIAITEWLADPFGVESEGEWVELYNFGATTVNLKNWRLKDEVSDNAVISTSNLFLPAGERLILARNKAKFQEFWLRGCADNRVINVPIVLSNTVDEIILENASGDVVWSVAYTNDATEGRATFYTETTYTNRVFGSRAAPGVNRNGSDITGTLAYQKNNSTVDNQAITSTNGDIGSPLNIEIAGLTRGNALNLGGADDYLDLGAVTEIENQSKFTFEAWIKPLTIATNSERIFSKRGNNMNRMEVTLGSGGNENARQYLEISICNGANETVTTANNSMPLGIWSHVVVVFDGTQTGSNRLKVYINGINQVVTGTLSATTTPAVGNTNIGRRPDNGNKNSNVEIDELRLWNVAHSAAQIRERMHLTLPNCTPGLVAYYQFNETSGLIAKNLKGNNAIYGDGTTAATFPNQIASPLNVGYGTATISQTVLAAALGTKTFATANLTLEIEEHSSAEDITVSYQTFAPNTVAEINAVNIIQNPMWTVNTSKGSETIKANYIFSFPSGVITSSNPLKYNLYWRTMQDGENWVKIATADIVTATTVKFLNITVTGQFMIVQESNDLISDQRGSMYKFNGTTSFIHVNANASLKPTDAISLETWVKVNSLGTFQGLIDNHKNTGTDTRGYFMMVTPSGNISTGVGSNPLSRSVTINSTTTLNVGEWYHVAMTFDRTNVQLYINGKLEATAAYGFKIGYGTLTSAMGLNIGKYEDDDEVYFLNGAMDEVRIWNIARTQEEIRENIHLTLKGHETGLVSYYQFDKDGTLNLAGAVKDATGTNNGQTNNMLAGASLASEVAVARGSFDRKTIAAAGTYDFKNTGVRMQFGATTPNGEIIVYRLETEKPHGAHFIAGDVDNEYFVVRNFGTASFTPLIDLSFERISYIAPADASLPQASSPLQLYKRSDNAYGNTWGTSLGGASSATSGFSGSVRYNTINNIASFSQIVVVNTGSSSDLPIELLYFEAERINADEVQLNWATATETNNQGFYLERMLDNEIQFSEITWIDGAGTAVNLNYYNRLDANSHLGTSYYRLKQLDIDGTITYSDIKAVEGRSSGKYLDLSIYPNPVSDKLTLEFKQLPKQITSATIKILTIDGKLVHQFSQKIKSNQLIDINSVKELEAGIYILVIETNDEEIITQKFVKR